MVLKLIAACVLAALEGYLLGSIVFGILISKLFCHDDVRTHGSGSAGMTNMLRTYGAAAGAATAIGDVAKGAVAVFIGEWLFGMLVPQFEPACGAYLAAIFAAIGHMKPAWFGFHGGKGVLVCGGAVSHPDAVLLGLERCRARHACIYRHMQRYHGGYGYLHAPLQHPATAGGHRVPLRREKEVTLPGEPLVKPNHKLLMKKDPAAGWHSHLTAGSFFG